MHLKRFKNQSIREPFKLSSLRDSLVHCQLALFTQPCALHACDVRVCGAPLYGGWFYGEFSCGEFLFALQMRQKEVKQSKQQLTIL
jgi:hypothetical protein